MQYERNDGFWSELVADVDDKDKQVTEGDQYVIAAIAVKSYSLEDHQFIRVKMTVANGKEITVYIPRNIVRAIMEGRGGTIRGFYSASSKSK